MGQAERLGVGLGPSGGVVEYLENSKYMAKQRVHEHWLM